MLKKIRIILITGILMLSLSPTVKAEYPTCTYVEGMYICYQDGRLSSVYCNYNDSESVVETCQERISENHKYKKYYRNKWKKHCENSAQKKRGDYCQMLNNNFLFYRDEFLNLFLEEMKI